MDGNIPHITWCATGPLAFLPLHAAGIYGSDDPLKQLNIFDFVVSSYSPNLSTLLYTSPHPVETSSTVKSTLIISQLDSPGQRRLPGTVKEVEAVLKQISPHSILHLNDENATVNAVYEAIDQHSWVHLACHGIQNVKEPLKSAFALHDGNLDLQALMGKSLKNAELAFLSACQTATGHEGLPDEAVHLAAGMLTAGFQSVIGTMWSIIDEDAPVVAEAFYSTLLKEIRRSEPKYGTSMVAYALNEAVKKLREKVGDENFERWVPFVHFGL